MRVSTAIEVFDPVTRRAVTRSRRVYELALDPGMEWGRIGGRGALEGELRD